MGPTGVGPTNVVAGAVLLGVLAVLLGRQATGRGPPAWALFVFGALVTVAVGVLPPSDAAGALLGSAPILVYLFALFLFASALERSGALDHLARWTIGRARRPADLPAVVFVGFGIVSAFLLNDALVVIGVPVLFAVARRLNVSARPLVLSLAFGVTVGSVLTPFGNPQNLLVALDTGLPAPTATFLRYLLLPTLLNLGLGAWYLRSVFARDLPDTDGALAAVRAEAPRLLPEGRWRQRIARAPVLLIFPVTILTLIVFDLLSALTGGPTVPAWETAAAGAAALLVLSPGRVEAVRRVSWQVLLLFAGLFVVVAGAVHGGVLDLLGPFTAPRPSDPVTALLAIVGSSTVGPQLVSNVPWVALEIPVLHGAGYAGSTPVAWMALAGASTLAGNVTLLGAASNLIAADLSERQGLPLRLGTFVRYGLPLAALTTSVLLATLLLGL